jgi:hypothetical protein
MTQSILIFRLSDSVLTHLLENPVEISNKKLAPEKHRTLGETARISASWYRSRHRHVLPAGQWSQQ